MIQSILETCLAGQRLTDTEALRLLRSPDWTSIIAAAHQKRLQHHPQNTVSYCVFRVINYTNYCTIDCSFCSFKDDIESNRGYTLNLEQIDAKVDEAQMYGATEIFLQGGVNPNLPLQYYIDVLKHLTLNRRMTVRAFSPIELYALSKKEGLTLTQLLDILKDAGLSSVPGAGAEILTENMRQQLSPQKLLAKDWCDIMGTCHQMGLPGSSNIVFGSTEKDIDIIEHLSAIRTQQDKTQGFLSFIPWVFQQQTKKFTTRHVPGWEYLRLLALSRLYFDNIKNIEVSVMVLGKDIAELALMAGANDISSIVIEENVLKSQGLKTIQAAQKFIRGAGFEPLRRTLNYQDYNQGCI